jgi:hypothetical protein
MRMRVNGVMQKLSPKVPLMANSDEFIVPKNYDCLKALIKTYEKTCGKMSDYEL